MSEERLSIGVEKGMLGGVRSRDVRRTSIYWCRKGCVKAVCEAEY